MSNKHILIVEDEADARMIMSSIAEIAEVQSTQEANAEDALVRLANHTYDAIIIDIGLPGMDGLELIQHIRVHDNHTPCVAVTAFHTSAMRHDALQAGFNQYFRKPIDAGEFVVALRDILAL